jgi:hypothetical protein
MKDKIYSLGLLSILPVWSCLWLVIVCGCISVPRLQLPSVPKTVAPAKPSIAQKIFEPTKAAAMEAAQPNLILPVKTPSLSAKAISKTVKSEVIILWLAGLACLAICGLCVYSGQIIPAVKFGIAGVLLPIFATWFAYHYILIIAGALVASAIGFLWAERNSAIEKGLITAAHNELTAAYDKLIAAVASAPPTPVIVSSLNTPEAIALIKKNPLTPA